MNTVGHRQADANLNMAAQLISQIGDADEAPEFLDFEVISPLSLSNTSSQLYPVEKLTAGCSILIEGKISVNCRSFVVNLRCGEDIVLHINPRFDQKYIARNAKINRTWGQEESQLLQNIPFSPGESFILEILVSPTEFMVGVNGLHLFTFGHRLSYSDIKQVEISREVSVTKFTLAQTTFYPSSVIKPADLPIKHCLFQGDIKCPVIAKLGSLQVGDIIEVTGRVHALPQFFYLNLQTGIHSIPHPVIAYHFVARYMPAWQVAMNSWCSGRWNEELSDKLPPGLFPGETFQLLITCLASGFSSKLGGKTLRILPHRVPVASANVLLIQGDVTIMSVNSSCVDQSSN